MPERVRQLSVLSIDWEPDWTPDDADWDARLTELLAFRRQRGHVQVLLTSFNCSFSGDACQGNISNRHTSRAMYMPSLPDPFKFQLCALFCSFDRDGLTCTACLQVYIPPASQSAAKMTCRECCAGGSVGACARLGSMAGQCQAEVAARAASRLKDCPADSLGGAAKVVKPQHAKAAHSDRSVGTDMYNRAISDIISFPDTDSQIWEAYLSSEV